MRSALLLLTSMLLGVSPCLAQDNRPLLEYSLQQFSSVNLALGSADRHAALTKGFRELSVPLDAIQRVERPRDRSRNGAAIGAGIGAGFGGAMFIRAMVVDRNEMDEWAPSYVTATAIFTGIGALIGWAIDAANSKPHISEKAAAK
jgi:hypothetical protein